MRLSAECNVSVPVSRTCLLVLFTFLAGAETLQNQETYLTPVVDKRLDVTARDVLAHSSTIDCAATCRVTSWCFAANLLPDGSTCQLLTEEVSDDDDSLLPADGWKYFREYSILYRNTNYATESNNITFGNSKI